MQEVEDFDDIHKVILIGDTAVGKTNIIFAFTKQRQPSNIGPTIGVEFCSKTVTLPDHQKIKTQIWDTAGQQQYRAVTMMLDLARNYRNSIGAMVVFDVGNRHTFEHVLEWVHSVREKALPNVQILLVGHKIDSAKRQVSTKEAQNWADSEKIPYIQTTIKDHQTIQRAFSTLLTNVTKVSNYYNQKNNVNLHRSDSLGSGCNC